MARPTRTDDRQWTDRRALATVVRVAVLGGPLLMAVLVVQALYYLALVHLAWPSAANLLAMAVTALVAGALAERATRRLLPLPGLLRMSMLFPDRPPSRLKVAKLGSSHRQLERLLVEGRQGRSQGHNAGEIVLGLVTALTQHGRRTRGHSERVRMYADLLSNEMGMTSHDRDRLRWAALLHDVGKLKIAPKVLNKPVALTEDEWQRMRMHPLWGAELAEPLMPWLGEWGKGIAEHHEKFDGYPQGLRGEEISPAGRMVAVIDAFETMTAARPYKQPMATATARAELARCAGTHFDPVVRAFLGVSLPRLLWAMGPLALVVHLPYLRELQLASNQISASASATATAPAPSPHRRRWRSLRLSSLPRAPRPKRPRSRSCGSRPLSHQRSGTSPPPKSSRRRKLPTPTGARFPW